MVNRPLTSSFQLEGGQSLSAKLISNRGALDCRAAVVGGCAAVVMLSGCCDEFVEISGVTCCYHSEFMVESGL